ncbi:MAG: hypothetical protein ABIQ93_10745 [Saprospiraceae bacterium]
MNWQNRGNAAAENVFVRVVLDAQLSVVEASKIYSQSGQELTFPLGVIAADSNGTIRLRFRLACAAASFSTHCTDGRVLQRGNWQPTADIPVQMLPNGAYSLQLWNADRKGWLGKFLIQH